MNSSTQKCFLVIAMFAVSAAPAFAQCHRSQPRRVLHRHAHTQPVYSQPVYSQPVYSQPAYSQPVQSQPFAESAPRPMSAAEAARMYTSDAKSLFMGGEFMLAKRKLDDVVKYAPKDSNAFQFRSLAAFAGANFDEAAADAYDSLGLGNAWTRPVIQSLYGNNSKSYETHLGTLKRVVANKPTMQSHFLLAYHHLMNERWSEGKVQLQKVLELQADEPLSTKLLAVVDQKLAETEQASR